MNASTRKHRGSVTVIGLAACAVIGLAVLSGCDRDRHVRVGRHYPVAVRRQYAPAPRVVAVRPAPRFADNHRDGRFDRRDRGDSHRDRGDSRRGREGGRRR